MSLRDDMPDPLTILILILTAWGVYRKLLKRHVDPYIKAIYWTLVPPELPPPPPPPSRAQSSAGVPTTKLFDGPPADPSFPRWPAPKGAKGFTEGAAERVRGAVAQLPKLVHLRDMDRHESSIAVPLGVDYQGRQRYLDFGDDTLNIAVYGVTKAGKDTLLMDWFLTLCYCNTPGDVQFIVLDGKGHWLTPNLKGLAHMKIDPCGGYGAEGNEIIEAGLAWINAEAARRSRAIFGSGCRSREQYVEKTGQEMPILVVLITDGIDAVQGLIEDLIVSLAAKGRALGFKLVMSMQTPTRRDMRWRINLSTVVSGALQDRTQNAVVLGLKDDEILFPPSLLPAPPQRYGTFVVRMGQEQTIVQAPFVSDEEFDARVAQLPKRDHLENMLVDEAMKASAPSARGRAKTRSNAEAFVEQVVTEAPGNRVTGRDLYDAYVEWCEGNGEEVLNPTAFGLAVKELLKKDRQGRGTVIYPDIALSVVMDKDE